MSSDLTPQPKALELASTAGQLELTAREQMQVAAELRRQHAEIEALQSLIRDEIDEGLRLRTLGGAGPDENITAMTERVIAERDSLRAEVEREREARKAAQIRQAELTDEVVRLEPMRQRAADIERLTAEVERLKQANHNQRLDICGMHEEVEQLRADADSARALYGAYMSRIAAREAKG